MTRVFYALRRHDGRNTEGGTQEMKDVNKRSRIAELINDHAADVPKRKAASKRMSSEERFEQIVDVAVKIIGQKAITACPCRTLPTKSVFPRLL